jgi:hypothetical protein
MALDGEYSTKILENEVLMFCGTSHRGKINLNL